MIKVTIEGRLGNQMFQYAFALASAKRLETDFYFYEYYKLMLPRYFELPEYGFAQKIRNFTIKIREKISKSTVVSLPNKHSPEKNLKKLKDNQFFHGYYQSTEYFRGYESLIKASFQIKPKWKSIFEKKYAAKLELDKPVVVHVRRTDYAGHSNSFSGGESIILPMGYYEKCFEQIANFVERKVYFVGDDLSFHKTYFKERKNFYFEENQEIVDFQLMLNAKDIIIANSSFSWWAAYLNKNPEKRVYAPKYWFGFKPKEEYPSQISRNLDFNWIEI